MKNVFKNLSISILFSCAIVFTVYWFSKAIDGDYRKLESQRDSLIIENAKLYIELKKNNTLKVTACIVG